MADDIVDDPYGPPHRYGSTIFDIFRPRPSAQKEFNQNLFASGYMGDVPYRVTEGRSPFGRLLQGVGLLGEPEARPLTPYEQMLVEEGRHYRGQEDYETEKERMDKLQAALNLGQDVISTGGGMPDEGLGLPPEMQNNLKRMLDVYTEESLTKRRHNELVNRNIQNEMNYRNAMIDQADIQKKLLNESREIEQMKKFASLPQIEPIYKEYKVVYNRAVDAASAGDNEAAMLEMEQMQKISVKLQLALQAAQVPGNLLDRMVPKNINVLDPFNRPGANTNIIKTPQDVDKTLQENMGWPPNRPAE